MTQPRLPPLARAGHPDEETRYQAVLALDPAVAAERAALLERLDDASWRVRSAAAERLGGAVEPPEVLPGLLAALEGAATPGGRDAAAAALLRLGPAALPGLVERLGEGSAEHRLAALAVLGPLGDRRAIPALAASLADGDANVRAAAAEALGRIGGPEAGPALLAALGSDDASLRAAALEGLCALRLAPPVWRLTRVMAERALRPAAYRCLGASDEPGALEVLGGGLSERSRAARLAVLSAIGQQLARRGLPALAGLAAAARAAAGQDPSVAETCLEALASEEPFVAPGAVAVLGWVGDARHAPALARAADDERLRSLVEGALDALPRGAELVESLSSVLPALSPLARVSVFGALAGAGSASALQALVYGAGDADPRVQAEAVAVLGRLGDPRAVPALGGLLSDEAPAAGGAAASALTRVAQRSEAGRRAVLLEARARCAASPSAALYRLLGAVGEGEDLRLVRHGVRTGEVAQRMAAAAAVAALGQRGLLRGEHLPELIEALADPAWAVRAAAARAFVELAAANAGARDGDPTAGEHPLCAEAMGALRRRLDDAEPAVCAAALEALGACGRPEHAAAVGAVADRSDAPPLVAAAALRALSRLGAATPAALSRGLAHPDPEVAREAVAAAARLPGEAGVALLVEAAGSPRWEVRLAAARAMAGRGEGAVREAAARLAGQEPDALVARAFAEAAQPGAGPGR